MLDKEASVFDCRQAGGASFFGSGVVFDAELEPENFCFDGDRGLGDRSNVFGTAEDVHDVDGIWDVFQASVSFFAKDFGFVGIHRNYAIAGGLKISGYRIAGAGGI